MNTQSFVTVFSGNLNAHTELLCDARELHQVLQVGRDFSNWIKGRIAEYGFEENQDFVAISQKREIGHGRGKIDYHLTLDTAKELAMVEKTEVGRQIRRYFIECEKKVHGGYELRLDRWLTEWEREQIRTAVKARCERTGESSQAVYRKLHAFMNLPSYEQIGAAQFQTALNFLASMENAPDLFRQPQGILITEEQIYQLSMLTRYASQMSELYRHLHPALRRLGSAYSGEAASWAEVPHYWVCKMQQFLMQAYKQMEDPKHIEGVKANFALMS